MSQQEENTLAQERGAELVQAMDNRLTEILPELSAEQRLKIMKYSLSVGEAHINSLLMISLISGSITPNLIFKTLELTQAATNLITEKQDALEEELPLPKNEKSKPGCDD